MGHVAPGLELVENMGKTMFVPEDVETIAQGLPEPLRSRFAGGPGGEGADFPPDLPRSLPLRVLDLPGWQFFRREKMKAFRREYVKLDEDLLLDPEDEE